MKNIEQSLALTISALLLFLVANGVVFIDVLIQQEHHQFIIFQSTISLFYDGAWYLALPMAIFVLIIPLLELILLLILLGNIYFKNNNTDLVPLIRTLHILKEWSMAEVFFVATLVAMIKIYSFGGVVFGFGFFAFMLMIIIIGIVLKRLDWDFIWKHACKQKKSSHNYCQKYGFKAHKNNGKQQAFAWLLSAVILYIPANIYPIMITNTLFQETKNNILQGIISLWQQQSFFVAMVILLVSIIVPITKMSIVFWLLIDYKNKQSKYVFYNLVEKIGRWSMVDVFVVVILVVIVQIDNMVSIIPGIAVVSFTLSIICSMVAVKYLSIGVFNEN
jgi:paraquat-inducible protein A